MVKHIVLYTDGSARPNPGYNGWGAHGFAYDPDEKVKKTASPNKHLITNKGYLAKTEAPKVEHEIVHPIEYYDWLGSNSELDSNNVAEMNAFIESVIKILEENIESLIIYTDSSYLLNGATKWIEGWKKNNWKKKDGLEVTNLNHWKLIDQLLEKIRNTIPHFELRKIKAHANLLGNEKADKLALVGYLLSTRKEEVKLFNISPPAKYWNPTISKHPFLCYKHLFFNTCKEFSHPGRYVLIDYKQDDDPGSKSFTSAYSVIELKEPDPLVELVINKQQNLSGSHSILATIRLDKLFSPEVYSNLNLLGEIVLMPTKGIVRGLKYIDGNFIVVEKDPPGLAMKVIENSSTLNADLTDYKIFKEKGKSELNNIFIDITDKLYSENDKGVLRLKPEINSTFKSFKVSVTIAKNNVDVPILIGKDTPPRNQLKKIETFRPVVYLCVKMISTSTVGYCTVIDTDNGLGVWSNFHSSSIFINQ
jgi:ribonuclease HI